MIDLPDPTALADAANQLASQAADAVQGAVSKKLVGGAAGAADAVYDWVKGKLSGAGRAMVLERVEANPTDARKRIVLEEELSDLLAKDPDACRQLADLLRQAGGTVAIGSQVIGDVGDGAKVNQISGSNISISQ